MPVASKLSRAARLAAADPAGYLRGAARLPLEQHAEQIIKSLPVVELAEITGATELTVRIGELTGRHAWSLGAAEQIILQAIIKARGARTAFEIGTFNGGTTRLLAETLPDDGQVWTVDLPPADFDATQAPKDFTGESVGAAYRGSPAEHKITQLLGNSLTFDFTPYHGVADLVLVDGGHEYVHGVADTKTALQLVKAGGVIVWDDFAPYWHGLVRGIAEAMQGRHLSRLAGSAFGIYVAE